MKKYVFKRGQKILGTDLVYVCEGGYRGKHRYILAKCDLCDTIKPFRLDSIVIGRTKSCGCRWRQMIDDGKLTQYSLKARNNKSWLQKGGYGWTNSIAIVFTKKSLSNLKIDKLGESIAKYLKEYANGELDKR